MAPFVSSLMRRTAPCDESELRALDGRRVTLVYASLSSRNEINFVGAVTGRLDYPDHSVSYVDRGIKHSYELRNRGILHAEEAAQRRPDGSSSVNLTKEQFLAVAERIRRNWKGSDDFADPEACWAWHQEYMNNIREHGVRAGVLGCGGP